MPRQKPTRSEATKERHVKFAEAMFRLGNASAALREVYPASRQWTSAAANKRAYELTKLPVVQEHLDMLKQQAKLDTVASPGEVTRFLAEVMRGLTKETVVRTVKASDGTMGFEQVEVPVGVAKRLAAAKQLGEILGYEAPKKVEHELSAVGQIPPHLQSMSDEQLEARIKKIEE